MSKWIISWDAGYGREYDIIEADSHEEAHKYAYDAWRDEVESNSDYDAEPYSTELAEDCGLE